jgi:hypothetical protein
LAARQRAAILSSTEDRQLEADNWVFVVSVYQHDRQVSLHGF